MTGVKRGKTNLNEGKRADKRKSLRFKNKRKEGIINSRYSLADLKDVQVVNSMDSL